VIRRALLVLALPAIMTGSANAADKAGVRADVFVGLSREAKEIYVAGITDALDEAGMLDCPPGTSYSQGLHVGCHRGHAGFEGEQLRGCWENAQPSAVTAPVLRRLLIERFSVWQPDQ
jgi:hypothetical protein